MLDDQQDSEDDEDDDDEEEDDDDADITMGLSVDQVSYWIIHQSGETPQRSSRVS